LVVIRRNIASLAVAVWVVPQRAMGFGRILRLAKNVSGRGEKRGRLK
jgi:hypothetical protein